VVRNRLRRRLRELLADSSLPPGLYLFGAQAAAVQRSAAELVFDLDRIVASVRG
jgi:RNase P protein component